MAAGGCESRLARKRTITASQVGGEANPGILFPAFAQGVFWPHETRLPDSPAPSLGLRAISLSSNQPEAGQALRRTGGFCSDGDDQTSPGTENTWGSGRRIHRRRCHAVLVLQNGGCRFNERCPYGQDHGNNLLAIAYSKAAEMAETLKDSGNAGRPQITGETGWQGGLIKKGKTGYLIAAFSGGPSESDIKVSQAGLEVLAGKL